MKKTTNEGWRVIDKSGDECPKCNTIMNTEMMHDSANDKWKGKCGGCGCEWDVVKDDDEIWKRIAIDSLGCPKCGKGPGKDRSKRTYTKINGELQAQCADCGGKWTPMTMEKLEGMQVDENDERGGDIDMNEAKINIASAITSHIDTSGLRQPPNHEEKIGLTEDEQYAFITELNKIGQYVGKNHRDWITAQEKQGRFNEGSPWSVIVIALLEDYQRYSTWKCS